MSRRVMATAMPADFSENPKNTSNFASLENQDPTILWEAGSSRQKCPNVRRAGPSDPPYVRSCPGTCGCGGSCGPALRTDGHDEVVGRPRKTDELVRFAI